MLAYYLRSLAQARQEMIVLLRGQLVLEGQDKVMLLQLIDEAGTRELFREASSSTLLLANLANKPPFLHCFPRSERRASSERSCPTLLCPVSQFLIFPLSLCLVNHASTI